MFVYNIICTEFADRLLSTHKTLQDGDGVIALIAHLKDMYIYLSLYMVGVCF